MRPTSPWLVVLLTVASGAVRQSSAADDTNLVGARVRLETMDSARLVGVVTQADEDALVIELGQRRAVIRVSRDDVARMEVSRGVRRRTLHGLLGGTLAWAAVVGLHAAFDALDESGVAEPWFIGGMIATGGIVGSQFKSERWVRVGESAASLRVSPRKRGAQVAIVLTF
jgi:hypothetical protein